MWDLESSELGYVSFSLTSTKAYISWPVEALGTTPLLRKDSEFNHMGKKMLRATKKSEKDIL